MSYFRLLLTNLLFHRRGNFAVFLGVALGTAVLTGALLVGDSLRGSLRALALDQLGWVHHAMPATRFFRADLADQIKEPSRGCPALLLRGSAFKEGKGRVNKINVLGVDVRFWPAEVDAAFWNSSLAEVVLNETLARDLGAQRGDVISLNVQKADSIPREYLLGKRRRQDVVEALKVTIRDVLPDHGMARFTLQPTPEPIRNAFVPMGFLQQALKQPGRADALLADAMPSVPELQTNLADWNLKLLSPKQRAEDLVHFLEPKSKDGNLKRVSGAGGWLGRVPEALAAQADPNSKVLAAKSILQYYERHRNYLLLESGQMLLEDAIVDAVKSALPLEHSRPVFRAANQDWWLCPMLIYLADSISDGKNEVSYAVVAGQGPLPDDKQPPLESGQIDLAAYPGAPLKVKAGDVVTVWYYAPDDHSHLQKKHEKFTVRKTFPLKGRFDDPDLVPQFPGITDKLDMTDWDRESLPFPYDNVRGNKENDFWKRYRTTPRAYVNLETAQKLWGSRFGKLTSYRFLPLANTSSVAAALDPITASLAKALDAQQRNGGFVWLNVRQQAEKAGAGSTDFDLLFVGFSFFLIAAALMLVGLLFRLNLDLRAREIGILLATGWTFPQVRWLLLGEGALLAVLGASVGLGGALGYADFLLTYLSQSWPSEQKLQFLQLHVSAKSLAIGWASSVAVSFLTIWWATRVLGRMTPTRLLAGETTAAVDPQGTRCYSHWVILASLLLAAVSFVCGLVIPGHEAQAGGFFGSGFFLLTACTSYVWRRLRRGATVSNPRQSLVGLAVRNAGRHALRSVLTIGLLASATFIVVAVISFHKEAGQEFLEKTGGSGGFPLYGQSDVPIFQDLNDPKIRAELSPAPLAAGVTFYPCRVQAGDDASCLNLYQPGKPRILGVPDSLIERGGFHFGRTMAQTDAAKNNPWLLLANSNAAEVPVFVDGNSAQWILHKALGDAYTVTDDQGNQVKLRIVGLFEEGVFQSEMVMSDANFRRLFPRREGFSFFLIDCPAGETGALKKTWEDALSDYGLSIETTSSRLDKYLAVENTYLATFQALGGLGLLLGAVGLAIVLLRSVWERRGELALLRALGFRRSSLALLVLTENAFLLLVGLTIGSVAALLSIAPQLVAGQAHVLGVRMLAFLGMVVVVGLSAGLAAVATTVRAPLLPALRND